ncbi:MAG: VWA domain-containing protein [Candidatus Taylorbacteria bacterium]|nr:VWA domain-containing protein [Candidatus Taylorbacteria bacterium]
MKNILSRFVGSATIVSLLVFNVAGAAVTPSAVEETMEIGSSTVVGKTVTTPPIPPKPDIIFLADTTGSMGPAIANVQANISAIMTSVNGSVSDAQFGAAQYRDEGSAPLFNIDQAVTANTSAVDTAVGTWTAGGGGDIPEAQINALFELGTNGGVGFRSGSTRIVVWFGDSSGHDPSNGRTLANAIAALTGAGIRVIAVPVSTSFGDGLDATGQATAITGATSGVLLPEATSNQVADAILTGLTNLPVTVSHTVDGCSPELNVTLSPASQTVTSGDNATFTETIAVANDPSLMGTTQSCVVHFEDENGNSLGDENIPSASKTNEDGFFVLGGSDNLDPDVEIYVKDSETGVIFGPFAAGTVIKYVEANGATPGQKPGAGSVDWQINGQGDAIVYSVDASGNVSAEAACLVAPEPK